MLLSKQGLLAAVITLSSLSANLAARDICETSYVPSCDHHFCCNGMGGIDYCDSSSGRYICSNGYISSCYCTRHAVMDLQKLQGCCLWKGGVSQVTEAGAIVCNNGQISEVCNFHPDFNVSYW